MRDLAEPKFPIVLLDGEEGIAEQMGTKAKFWIKQEGGLKLVKFGRSGTGENWSEKIACELASLIGIPHADYDLAEANGVPCVVSHSIIPAGFDLLHGNQIIGKTAREEAGRVRLYRTKEHTLSRVVAAIYVQTRPNYLRALEQFAGYLMFDAWIGNTDRHEENWALLVGPDGAKTLAPTFDHASSLGRELHDKEKTDRMHTRDARFNVVAFASRARSALFENATDRKPLRPIEAFREVGKIAPDGAVEWLRRLGAVDEANVRSIFERMPEGSISNASIDFAYAMLSCNRAALLSLRSPGR